jgi:dehydrogenase/reductase SDR family protein 12
MGLLIKPPTLPAHPQGLTVNGARAYARAKCGLMMMTETWSEQLQGSGVAVNAMHPGWANTPGVRKSLPASHRQMNKLLRSPQQGADTIVWLAAAPEAAASSGKFCLDREPHLSAIFPGTAGSPDERRQLRAVLEQWAQQGIA